MGNAESMPFTMDNENWSEKDGRMQAISVKAVSEVLPSGTAGSCAEAEAGIRTLGASSGT